jgi:hypothetical protein
MDNITEFSNAFMTSISGTMAIFMSAIPKIFAFLVIIILGWIIASLIASGIASLLRRIKFNDIAQKAGIATFIHKTGSRLDSSGMVALVVKWFVRLIALVVAFDGLGLTAVSTIFTNLLNWIPNLLVSMVILVIGGWAANAISSFVRGAASMAESTNTEMVANLSRTAVLVLTGMVAFNQLGIASDLVQILFTAIVGTLSIGVGLAVGLGGKEVAGEILRKWYDGKK